MSRLIKDFRNDDRGATAIEYALIAAGIALGILVAVQSVGTGINTMFAALIAQMP